MKHLNEDHLKRIADILEEILKLVKKDMEPRTKKNEKDYTQRLNTLFPAAARTAAAGISCQL